MGLMSNLMPVLFTSNFHSIYEFVNSFTLLTALFSISLIERCDGVKCHYYSTCKLNEQNIAECVCPQVCIR